MPNTIECRYPKVFDQNATNSLAIYSEDNRQCRYLLERIWDSNPNPQLLMFVMLQSSTATAMSNNDDRAVSKCEERARKHHLREESPLCFGGQEFGGVCVTNVFPFIQTGQNPPVNENDPNYIKNLEIIEEYVRMPNTTVVCAWGETCDWGEDCDYDMFLNHAERIKRMLFSTGVPLNYFGLTQEREQPTHVYRHEDIENFRRWRI